MCLQRSPVCRGRRWQQDWYCRTGCGRQWHLQEWAAGWYINDKKCAHFIAGGSGGAHFSRKAVFAAVVFQIFQFLHCFQSGGSCSPAKSQNVSMIFVVMWVAAGWLSGRFGNRKWISGFNFRESCSMMPAFVAISISPTQKDMIPIIVMHSVIASLEESSAALVMSGMRPVNAA